MTATTLTRLHAYRKQLEALETQERKRAAYMRGVRRAHALGKYLRLSVGFGAGVLFCQAAHLLIL